jgi:hypothetical protein
MIFSANFRLYFEASKVLRAQEYAGNSEAGAVTYLLSLYDVSFWSFLSALSLYCRRMYRMRSMSGPMSNPPKRNSIWRPSLNPNSMAHLAEMNAQTTLPLINA